MRLRHEARAGPQPLELAGLIGRPGEDDHRRRLRDGHDDVAAGALTEVQVDDGTVQVSGTPCCERLVGGRDGHDAKAAQLEEPGERTLKHRIVFDEEDGPTALTCRHTTGLSAAGPEGDNSVQERDTRYVAGGPRGDRTHDPVIKSHVLYH